MSKQYRPETIEECALQRFGKEISQHEVCRTVLDGNLFLLDTVCDPKVSVIDMLGLLAGRGPSILLQAYGAFIILVEDDAIVAKGNRLSLEEVLCP